MTSITSSFGIVCTAPWVARVTTNGERCVCDTTSSILYTGANTSECVESKFEITTTNRDITTVNTTVMFFVFRITAKGTYYIDWGDGSVDKVVKTSTNTNNSFSQSDVISHQYGSGPRTIRIGGGATGGYNGLGYLPAITFANIDGVGTPQNIYKIKGSLGALFPTSNNVGTNEVANPRFNQTFFGCELMADTDEPDPNNPGKYYAIPPTLFTGITGVSALMFDSTFAGCNELRGTIPGDLFGRVVNGEYSGIDGVAFSMFSETFSGDNNLTGSIPETLFGRYVNGTYYGVKGSPTNNLFDGTFWNCSGLTGSIPENLFAGINGDAKESMFAKTFANCSGLSGSIPGNLFGRVINGTYHGIKGTPQPSMFEMTFEACENLTGNIPGTLFGRKINGTYYGISGDPAEYMFAYTFDNCWNLTGTVPPDLFAGINNDPVKSAKYQMSDVFENSGVDMCPPTSISYETGFEEWFSGREACTACPNGKVANSAYTECVDRPNNFPFTLTVTTNDEPNEDGVYGRVCFDVGAAGEFFFDCGDVGGLWADYYQGYFARLDADENISSVCCHYWNSGQHTISITGLATGYPTSEFVLNDIPPSAIRFDSDIVTGIHGSLGAIFPTLSDNTANLTGTDLLEVQPRFIFTFYGLPNLTGTIPDNLFTGIYGNPAPNMFAYTFNNNQNLYGPIPDHLFGNLSGTEVDGSIFEKTFTGDTNLGKNAVNGSSTYYIPASIFDNMTFDQEVENYANNDTFRNTGLLESCPSNTFQYNPEYDLNGKVSCEAIPQYEFFIDTTSDTVGEFTLYISAAGKFFIDWGDNSPVEFIPTSKDSGLSITHTYETQQSYTISIGGTATDYSEVEGVLYYENGREFVAALRGSLGHVFPTIRNSNNQIIAQPLFFNTFYGCTSLKSISANLFDGVTGAAEGMFSGTFAYTPITSIPETLFEHVTGGAEGMFYMTFAYTPITSIPETLFEHVTGGAEYMFYMTFAETQITFIPAGLFNGITNAADFMFWGTFEGCTELGADPKITNPIPATLFEHVTGAADGMYSYTFFNCTSLQSIPENLFPGVGDVTGVQSMFGATFYGCTSLTQLPNSLFPNITGTPAEGMFYGMFMDATNLSGYVPPTLFANLTAPNPYPDTGDDPMEYIFEGTNLDTSCTAPLIQYTTGFESDWSGKVSCIPANTSVVCGAGQKPEISGQCESCSGEPNCPNQPTLWLVYTDVETGDEIICIYDAQTGGCLVQSEPASNCTEMAVMGATMCLIDGLPGVNTKALIARKDGQTYHMLLSQTVHTITSESDNQLVIIDSGGTWYAHDESVE